MVQNGTRDYRFTSWLILAEFIMLMAIQFGITSIPIFSNGYPMMIWYINIVLFFLLTALIATLRPHKSDVANSIGVYTGALLGIGSTMYIFVEIYLPKDSFIFAVATLMSSPHFVFLATSCFE